MTIGHQHQRSTSAFNVRVQCQDLMSGFNVRVPHKRPTSAFNVRIQCQGSTSEANVSIQRQRPMTTSIRALLSCPDFVPCLHALLSCHASMPSFRALLSCSDFVPCFHAILRVALLRIEFLHTNELILLREFDFLHQIGL